jgi:hypothetical protein
VPLFTSLRPATGESASTTVRHLRIFVLFTDPESTAAALRAADCFAADLGGDILIAAPIVVPYPLPLNCSPVSQRTLLAQISNAVVQSGIRSSLQKVLIAYTRERLDGWRSLLPTGCIVVIGNPRSPMQRFRNWFHVRSLRKLGHEVVVAKLTSRRFSSEEIRNTKYPSSSGHLSAR